MKLLILSAEAGSGHIRAAEALAEAAKNDPAIAVEHVCITDYASPIVKSLFFSSYEKVAHTVPRLWGWMYGLSDNRTGSALVSGLTKMILLFDGDRLFDRINASDPDIMLHTHPASVLPVSFAQERGRVRKVRQVSVITDYAFHRVLFNRNISKYFVASDAVRDGLIAQGAGQDTIIVSGIPIDQRFLDVPDRAACKKLLGIESDQPIVLVLAGGKGISDNGELIRALMQHERGIHIIAIAGANAEAEQKLRLLKPGRHAVSVIGWTDRMHAYLSAADYIITKGGALTLTECMALGKRPIIFKPVPGQETKNMEWFVENDLGFEAREVQDVLEFIRRPADQFCSEKKPAARAAADIILEHIRKETENRAIF